jgi:hypothetical protein
VPDYEQLRHEREQIDAGARALRSRAIADGYRSLERKAVTFSFALILDECALHLGQLTPEVRTAAMECCRRLTDAGRQHPTRACPVDHGTGSRSQILIEATSMVPRNM